MLTGKTISPLLSVFRLTKSVRIPYTLLVNIMNFIGKKTFFISYPKGFPYRIQIILDKHTSTFLIKE